MAQHREAELGFLHPNGDFFLRVQLTDTTCASIQDGLDKALPHGVGSF